MRQAVATEADPLQADVSPVAPPAKQSVKAGSLKATSRKRQLAAAVGPSDPATAVDAQLTAARVSTRAGAVGQVPETVASAPVSHAPAGRGKQDLYPIPLEADPPVGSIVEVHTESQYISFKC